MANLYNTTWSCHVSGLNTLPLKGSHRILRWQQTVTNSKERGTQASGIPMRMVSATRNRALVARDSHTNVLGKQSNGLVQLACHPCVRCETYQGICLRTMTRSNRERERQKGTHV